MKTSFLIFIVLVFVSCNAESPVLNDKGKDKHYLNSYISGLKKEKQLGKHPVLVIDGDVYNLYEAGSKRIPLFKADILTMDYLPANSGVARRVYGDVGENGVVLILTDLSRETATATVTDDKLVYMINDRTASKEEFDALDKNLIRSIRLLKGSTEISKYAGDSCTLVLISLN